MVLPVANFNPSTVAKAAKSQELPPEQAKKLKEAAEEFEAIFVNLMLKSMRDSVEKSGLMDGGNGEDIFRSMLDSEYSKAIASERKTSIANTIEREMRNLMIATNEGTAKKGIEAYQRQADIQRQVDVGFLKSKIEE